MANGPSYDLKIDRADQHLAELDDAIDAYCASHPYEMVVTPEGKNKPGGYRFRFTEPPKDEIAIIAGDFLYNIHSALNHLACSFVPAKKRRSVAFPIFWQGIWEAPVKGENQQRYKDRERWNSYTREMPDGAVALLKSIQPLDTGPNETNDHPLVVLNRLRNADAHGKLVVVASALTQPTLTCRVGNEIQQFQPPADTARRPGEGGLYDGTKIPVPRGAVNVKVRGTPQVVVHIGGDVRGDGVRIKESFRDLLLNGARNAIEHLRPFDRSA